MEPASKQDDTAYRFGHFLLDVSERTLSQSGRPIPLPPRVFDTLVLLVRNAGHLLTKDRLLHDIWGDAIVEENNLAQAISQLRRVLQESPDQRYIETVPKHGYRFLGSVEHIVVSEPSKALGSNPPTRESAEPLASESPRAAAKTESGPLPVTHYVANGDVNLAYQVIGSGNYDLVFVMGWITHLEYFWREPRFRRFLERLSSFARLILFDKRGTGLSDRVPPESLPTLEQRMEDVHAVLDAVQSERAVLIGVSEGGPMCCLFAATYPERTQGLVMIGTYAKRIRSEDYPWAPTLEQREAFFRTIRDHWGTPVGIEERAPSLANDSEFREWWATYLRMGASPGAAVALTRMNAEIDVRNVLPSIQVPTLVIHRRGDACLRVEEGRYVASRIPGSRFVELPGNDHLPFVGNQDEMLNEIETFVKQLNDSPAYDRILATVVSVSRADASASRPTAAANQPPPFQEATGLSSLLRKHRGVEISAGDSEFSARFDGPSRAVHFVCALMQIARDQGIALRAGIHTGECDVIGNQVQGWAVDFANQLANRAAAGTILVSQTVKDLAAGSGIIFQPCKDQVLKGSRHRYQIFSIREG